MADLRQVELQMEEFGIVLRKGRDVLRPDGKKRTCGAGGKFWVKLYEFHPDSGGTLITGSFGSYKTGDWQKVELDRAALSDAERERMRREQDAKAEEARKQKAEEAALAAMSASELLKKASREGQSPYIKRKQVKAEGCRYLADGTLVLPLMRYDWPMEHRLRAVQRILPNGAKLFTKGFEKPGCCTRLGVFDPELNPLILVVEGYATGLTARMATDWQHPVFVALDAGNLAHVVPLLRRLYPSTRILILADDDWQTRDQQTMKLNNPGRTAARAIAKQVDGCDYVTPVFNAETRQKKDTDFNDLHVREGIEAVRRQLRGVVAAMARFYG